jgi:hypothetical protein
MKEIIEKILLKESIEFNGSISELKEQIRFKKERKFSLDWFSENEFKALSKFSLGTLIIDGFPGATDGIKAYGKLTELTNGKTKIELRTKLRIELYFVSIIPILAITVVFLTGKEIPLWSIFLFPFIVLWFWFIYRLQEKLLFGKIKKYISTELKKAAQQ